MPVSYVFAGPAVADYPSSRDWYERLLGRPPDRLPNETEAVWNVITLFEAPPRPAAG